jgi:hypothetical protein
VDQGLYNMVEVCKEELVLALVVVASGLVPDDACDG